MHVLASFLCLQVFDFAPQVMETSCFDSFLQKIITLQLPAIGISVINCSFNNTMFLPYLDYLVLRDVTIIK